MSEYLTMQAQTISKPTFIPTVSRILQRTCACGKHTNGDGECEECKKKRLEKERAGQLQRAALSSGPSVAPSIVHDVLHTSGQPLDARTRDALEPRFGHDFSRVRLHTDSHAADSARAVNALAYTVGGHIVFGAGQYAPNTTKGQRLIVHELTHVMQQRDMGSNMPSEIGVGPVGDSYEREADVFAGQVSSRGSVRTEHERATSPVLRRQPDPHRFDVDKKNPRAESEYRRAGLNKEADAVRNCREIGTCNMVLTEEEVWQWYETGRRVAGIEPSNKQGPQRTQAGAVPLAVGALTAPAAEGATTAGAATQGALTRASAQWGTEALVFSGDGAAAGGETAALALVGEETALVTAGEGAAVAGGAAAGTVLIPIAVGVVVVVALVSLFSYLSFKSDLQRQGFTILPDPLACAIGNCHQPTQPTYKFRDFPDFPAPTQTFPRFRDFPGTGLRPLGPGGQLAPDEYEILRRWIEQNQPTSSGQTPKTQPTPQPIPTTQPTPQDRKKHCEDLYKKYEPYKSCRACNKNDTVAERAAKIACIQNAITGRENYLNEKCDYVLDGSIKRGSAIAEKGHQLQLAQLKTMLANCQKLPTK